jgi:4-hydroxy-tetrahydrodipicolinate reductase
MGQTVRNIISQRRDMILTGAVEFSGCPSLGRNISQLDWAEVFLRDSISQAGIGADVYIDFTSPASSMLYLEQAAAMGLPAVIGTTGLSAEQQARLKEISQKIPVFWAPNMSIGVNVMYKIAAAMTKMLGPDYDIEILEAHHHNKVDAPSGTALKLQETIAQARNLSPKKTLVTGRQGQVGARTPEEIGVLALRGGDIVGDHTVFFCGPGERLELIHRAQTRDTFAQGAVRAAQWLVGKAPGLYSIEDTLEDM